MARCLPITARAAARSAIALALLAAPPTTWAQKPSHSPPPESLWGGPTATSIDLLRPGAGASRIYVQAILPDGERGLFLVDTGAAISTLSADTAERLGLQVEDTGGWVSGLGGQAPLHRAEIDTLVLGDAILSDVEFAIGVRGVPDRAGMMPLEGILGNNVWSLFDVEIDYPADLLVLRRPGSMKMSRRAVPMFFDGSFVWTPIEVTTAADPARSEQVMIQVDTGAGELLLSGATGDAFSDDYTEGIEQIRGIGASETLPPSKFLQETRRIPLTSVKIGGRTVQADFDARWLNFDGARVGPEGMQGLAGHELLAGHVAKFDYATGRLSLERSRRKARQIDGHEVLYAQDLAQWGEDPSRSLYQAKLLLGMDRTDDAIALLEPYVSATAEDPEARILLASMHRWKGDLEGAWRVLSPLSPAELVEEREILAVVNGLLLDGHAQRARELAEAAVGERPEESLAHVALADVLLATGDAEGANVELLKAARLEGYPDAFLNRRVRAAVGRGDTHAALAHLRKLLQLYPSGGSFLWFYAMLVQDGTDSATFTSDMEQAISRLHPQHKPLDFMVAAHHALGDDATAIALMKEGVERDCDQPDAPSRDNCVAWYLALAGQSPDEALERIDRALSQDRERSDFLDTKAMVHLMRGELPEAHAAALSAARLAPDDWYMLWQENRLEAMAQAAGSGAAAAVP